MTSSRNWRGLFLTIAKLFVMVYNTNKVIAVDPKRRVVGWGLGRRGRSRTDDPLLVWFYYTSNFYYFPLLPSAPQAAIKDMK